MELWLGSLPRTKPRCILFFMVSHILLEANALANQPGQGWFTRDNVQYTVT